jgi:hypothetical protein
MARCLVIVSPEERGLFERLTALYRDEEWIDILPDRHTPHRLGAEVAPNVARTEGQEEPNMETFEILSGIGLLFIGIAVADGIRIVLAPHIRMFLEIYRLKKRRASRPILLAEWNQPRPESRHLPPVHP